MKCCDYCLEPIDDDAVMCFSCLSPQTSINGPRTHVSHEEILEDLVRTVEQPTRAEIFADSITPEEAENNGRH